MERYDDNLFFNDLEKRPVDRITQNNEGKIATSGLELPAPEALTIAERRRLSRTRDLMTMRQNEDTRENPTRKAKPKARKFNFAKATALVVVLVALVFIGTQVTAWARGGSPEIARLAAMPGNPTPTLTPFLPNFNAPAAVPGTPEPPATVAVAAAPPAEQSTESAPKVEDKTPIAIESGLVNSTQAVADVGEGHEAFLLLGSDQRPNEVGMRTDAIMLVIVNKSTNAVSVISFPRDLIVTIPGWGEERINTVFQTGGFDLLSQTIEFNFGVKPNYYALTYFWTFIETVDSLGGLDVPVPEALYDQCEAPDVGYCSVEPGMVHMDGKTALWYVRSRRTSSDFARGERQQLIVKVLFQKLMSMDAVRRGPELYGIFSKNVETDISLDEVIRYLPAAAGVFSNHENLKTYAIGAEQTYPYVTYTGASVLLGDQQAIMQIINEALSR